MCFSCLFSFSCQFRIFHLLILLIFSSYRNILSRHRKLFIIVILSFRKTFYLKNDLKHLHLISETELLFSYICLFVQTVAQFCKLLQSQRLSTHAFRQSHSQNRLSDFLFAEMDFRRIIQSILQCFSALIK